MGRSLRRLVTVSVSAVLLATASADVQAAVAGSSGRGPSQSATDCGAPLSSSDGSLRTCTFADDFSGSRLDGTKWVVSQTADSGFHSGIECMVDSPNNIKVSAGTVKLTVRKESKPFLCTSPYGSYQTQYTGASINTYGKFAQAYGRFEIRAKFPSTKVTGIHSAIWMYPQVQKYGAWPASGEIDIAEFYSKYPDRAIPYVHYKQDAYDPTATNTSCMIADPTQFHTYAMEWTPQRITILYDGVTCLVHTIDPAGPLVAPAPFDNPFMVVLTQALGSVQNLFDPATTPLPATTEVDYVRAWS